MLSVVDHPLIKYKVSMLRDKNTGPKEFRELVQELAMFLTYEATRDLELTEYSLETPLARTTGYALSKKVAVVPVMRAGLAMAEGVLRVIPNAKVGHVGLYRDHDTLKPIRYYAKLPDGISDMVCIVVDPMLATGNSIKYAVDMLRSSGCTRIKVLSIIAAPEGVANVLTGDDDLELFVAAVDERLNDLGYIVPGLGDAGDRLYGTK
ncbi:uracil phosphoribosyltransferase [Coprothermobacteraceae bacterium]|nr:uracil phosphoribosyltransferase [Coprothermobacteraceae bacterium]